LHIIKDSLQIYFLNASLHGKNYLLQSHRGPLEVLGERIETSPFQALCRRSKRLSIWELACDDTCDGN